MIVCIDDRIGHFHPSVVFDMALPEAVVSLSCSPEPALSIRIALALEMQLLLPEACVQADALFRLDPFEPGRGRW